MNKEAFTKQQAKRASEEEKEKLWPTICGFYSDYQVYQERTQRNIPVLISTPIENEMPKV